MPAPQPPAYLQWLSDSQLAQDIRDTRRLLNVVSTAEPTFNIRLLIQCYRERLDELIIEQQRRSAQSPRSTQDRSADNAG